MSDIVIAVDPGRDKCGVAVVHRQDGVLYRKIINASGLVKEVEDLSGRFGADTVVVGDRTTGRRRRDLLRQAAGGRLTVVPVDEHRSTDEARRLYWEENPPRGLRRLIPVTMQAPPAPVDDYAAVILARRYFHNCKPLS